MRTGTSKAPATSDVSRLLRALDLHGPDLHRVASVLTGDPSVAGELILRAVMACRDDGIDPGLNELSAPLVLDWLDRPVQRPVDVASLPSMLQDVHALADDQRALLALCRFGAHTYREAALLLELPADTAADLLRSAMRTLQAPESVPLTA